MRYPVVSVDCHAGLCFDGYREYLDPVWRGPFDEWREGFVNRSARSVAGDRSRNWDSARRVADLDYEGVAVEVVFPNTITPFALGNSITGRLPVTRADYARGLAGIRAHNRWLKEFCDDLPERRCGLPQVFLNDLDDTLDDLEWIAENGFTSFMLPPVPPDGGVPGLYDPIYDRIWKVIEDFDLTITQHSGAGTPNYGNVPSATILFLMESAYFAHRHLSHMILSGVFHRFPQLRYVMTEQDVSWVIKELEYMDEYHLWATAGVIPQLGDFQNTLPDQPSDYFHQNVWIGASFPTPSEADAMQQVGVDRMMWGNDYPHKEGTFPYTRQHLQRTFHNWKEADLRKIFFENACGVYRIDINQVEDVVARIGPTVKEVATRLKEIPPDTLSVAFIRP